VGTGLVNNTRLVVINEFGCVFLYLLLIVFYLFSVIPVESYCLLNYQYLSDSLSLLSKLIFIFFLFFFIVVSLNYFSIERIYFVEYYFLLGFLCLSAFFLMSSNDFFMFYFSLELQALILYTLASLKRYNSLSAESGLKYFVLGAFSSGLLLFGISLFYGFFGITNFYDLKFIFLK
jgi:NADH:ubiquinone oxidoreductase subunit 2 (subunit N)